MTTDHFEEKVEFLSEGLVLEGFFHPPAVDGFTGVVVCHPHPAYGGDMGNTVVRAICREVARDGRAYVRFNFRGVGESDGEQSGGVAEETSDALAAASHLWQRCAGRIVGIDYAGYSYGGIIALRSLPLDPQARAGAAVAPPVSFMPVEDAGNVEKPKLAVVPTLDAFCKKAALEAWYAKLPEPKKCLFIEGANHFLVGREREAGSAVADFLAFLDKSAKLATV